MYIRENKQKWEKHWNWNQDPGPPISLVTRGKSLNLAKYSFAMYERISHTLTGSLSCMRLPYRSANPEQTARKVPSRHKCPSRGIPKTCGDVFSCLHAHRWPLASSGWGQAVGCPVSVPCPGRFPKLKNRPVGCMASECHAGHSQG